MPRLPHSQEVKILLDKIDSIIEKGLNNPDLEADLRLIRQRIEDADQARQWRKVGNLAIHLGHWLCKYLNL